MIGLIIVALDHRLQGLEAFFFCYLKCLQKFIGIEMTNLNKIEANR